MNCVIPKTNSHHELMIFAVYKLVTSFFDSQPGSSDPNWRQTLAGVTAKKNVKAMLAVDLAQNDSRVMACIFKYFDPNTTTVGEMLVKLHSLSSEYKTRNESEVCAECVFIFIHSSNLLLFIYIPTLPYTSC